MCLCVLEIPVCCLVAAVASEVGCVYVWRKGEVVREGGGRGREGGRSVFKSSVCYLVSEVGSVCGGRDGGRSVRGRREGGVEE